MKAVTYARQSKQREDESQGSPEAQRQQARALIVSRGWTFVEHYEDLGASGYDPNAPRPGLDAALAAVAQGRADVLVVYRLDRLTRRGVGEAIRIVDHLRDNGASLVSVHEPFLDTTSPMGTGIFSLFAAMAQQESENISTRSRGAKAALREVGSHAGGRPPFGFTAVREVQGKFTVRNLVPESREADVVREAVSRVLDGSSVASLAREFNARNLRPRSGSDWTTSTLTRVLRAPQLAGYMPAHRPGRNAAAPTDSRGRILMQTDADGVPLQPWEPIIEPGEWHRLQDALEARPVIRGSTKQPSLLGGTTLLVCSLCGGGMGADRRSSTTTGGNYRCMKHRRSGTCTGTSVAMVHAEEHVARAVFSRLAALDPADEADADLLVTVAERFNARNEDGEHAAERRALESSVASARSALERLDDDRAAGLFDGATGTARYRRQVSALTSRLEGAQKALDALPAPGTDITPWLDSLAVGETGPIGPGSPWESWSVAERREFLTLALDRVEVLPPVRRHAGGNAPFRGTERLRLVWAS
ncbi:recombinase family protein [Arthrobacter sp. NPDC089319]|uniref:recombinase family protein n=1 Tax=Arthrobacter sp. NPDC089319 TaxID=3155915 RepID=UPI00341F691B